MSIHMFIDDDEAYLEWAEKNPAGYIVNCDRVPKGTYLVLHLSSCPTVTEGDTPWTSNFYIKVCSTNLDHLNQWADKHVGGEFSRLCQCMMA